MNALDQFMSKVSPCPVTGCWWWTAGVDKDGYGKYAVWNGTKQRHWRAHRYSMFLAGVDVENDLVAMHSCDQPSCVNPAHLSLGTQKQNKQDCARKGRTRRGEQNINARLSEADVLAIRASPESARSLSFKYGVSSYAAWAAKVGRNWKHLPMPVVTP